MSLQLPEEVDCTSKTPSLESCEYKVECECAEWVLTQPAVPLLRLTISKKRSLIRIPITNGDREICQLTNVISEFALTYVCPFASLLSLNSHEINDTIP